MAQNGSVGIDFRSIAFYLGPYELLKKLHCIAFMRFILENDGKQLGKRSRKKLLPRSYMKFYTFYTFLFMTEYNTF